VIRKLITRKESQHTISCLQSSRYFLLPHAQA